MEHLRTPPHSIEAEQAVLGGLMIDGDSWERVSDRVCAADFYRTEHRIAFDAISALAASGKPHDMISVIDYLTASKKLDDAGGQAGIAALVMNVGSIANISSYAGIVRERALIRSLISTANAIADKCFDPQGEGAADLISFAEQQVFRISDERKTDSGPVHVKEALSEFVDDLDERFNNGGKISGIPTGFADLDEKLHGMEPSDLIIVAGRPSMGKTTFAMNIAETNANAGNTTLVFSMEMPKKQLIARSVASLGRIHFDRIRSGKMEDEDWPRLTGAVGRISESNLIIDDTAALSVTEMRARARRVKREHGLSLIVIDYLQLARGNGENRAQEVGDISRGLKALAKEMQVPVIALSQLNRKLEQRSNKRPTMGDLRDSGEIEQDADVILFCYRDEVYNEESPAKGTAEIIIGKQRNGPIGTVRLAFVGHYCRFENYSGDDMPMSHVIKSDRWAGGFSG